MSKSIVISGGGSWGAWGAGLATTLVNSNDYKYHIGSSTGSLITALLADRQTDLLRHFYTTSSQNDIFNVNPFKKNGDLKYMQSIWRIITRKRSLGENIGLMYMIDRYYHKAYYDSMKASNRVHVACVYNMDERQTEYKSSEDFTHSEMKTWSWLSTTVPVFCSYVRFHGAHYVDASVGDHVPLAYMLEKVNEVDQLDIIIHRYRGERKHKPIKNTLGYLTSTFSAMLTEISESDMMLIFILNEYMDINVYYMPEYFETDSLVFNKRLMGKWYEQGLNQECEHQFYPKGTIKLVYG